MAQKLGSLPLLAKVKDTETQYYGKPIIWRKADNNHFGYPSNSVTLITDRIICIKGFDGKEPGNADSDRASRGNNRYRTSNIRQWLNSDGEWGSWWMAQNLSDGIANTNNKDSSPTSSNMSDGYGYYNTEKGFLANFSTNMYNALLDTTLTVMKNTRTDGGGTETVTDKIFLPSVEEANLTAVYVQNEGVPLAIFSDNASRVARPTAEAITNSNFSMPGDFTTSKGWYWRLRTPSVSSSNNHYSVAVAGGIGLCNANDGWLGILPLCNISSDTLVSDTPDADGAYIIVWKYPPTPPPNITPPSSIAAGTDFTVSWNASTDPDGDLSGYKLERQFDNGGWEQIYQGAALSKVENIPQFAANTVAYRVKAYDSHGLESGYITSDTRTIINNQPPVVSGTDSDLGTKSDGFSVDYTVTDAEGDTVAVVEKIDGVAVRSFTAVLGAANAFSVTGETWHCLLNGNHTLTVTASDDYTAVMRTWTFTKAVHSGVLTRITPIETEAGLYVALSYVTGNIPEGALFKLELCNNGFDAQPTWEDATVQTLESRKFFFANGTKTAGKWGFNYRLTLERGTAEGSVYLLEVGGFKK